MTQMTGRVSEETVEACRHVPLHVIIGDTRLNKKIKIACPFHPERTPSCTLFPTGGFHCFGCGANGNSIDFLIKLGATYSEALDELSKHV